MFKKLLFFFFVATTAITAQKTISGTFTPADEYKWVIAYKLKPGTQGYVTDSKVTNGKFTLTMPADAKPGTYRIVYALPQEEFYFDVLYSGKEDVSLTFNEDNGVAYTSSKENILLSSYFNEVKDIKQQIINFYKEGNTAKKELANIYSQLVKIQSDYEEKSSGLLANVFIKANKSFIPKKHETIYDYVENKKTHYFDVLDYTNQTLQASNFLTDKSLNYVFTSLPLNKITKTATENILQQNVQKLSEQLKGTSEKYRFHMYYELWLYAAQRKYNATSDFIYKNYIKSLSNITNNQELAKGIEVHNRLRIGEKAPNIEWNNGKKSLATIASANNYVLIFWSSTCSHCLKELPKLNEGMATYPETKVLAYGLEENDYDWKRVTAEMTNFIHALGLGKWDNKYADIYNISQTPTYFVLNKDKRIIAKPENYDDVLAFLKKQKH